MKLTIEDKKKIIEMKKNGASTIKIAKMFNINESYIRFLVLCYRKHGELIYEAKLGCDSYSPEFKFKLVCRVLTGDSMSSLGIEHMIRPSSILGWVRQYNELGYNGLTIDRRRGRPRMKPKDDKVIESSLPLEFSATLSDEERKELVALRKENEQLKMEIDFSKKLRALVRERIKRERKK